MLNVLPELAKRGFDQHEALQALFSAVSASGYRPTGKRTYDLSCGDRVVAQAAFNQKGSLKSLLVPSREWREARATILSDHATPQHSVARTVMFAPRRLTGAFACDGWLQIRPVALSLEDRTPIQALSLHASSGVPLPFAVEVTYLSSTLPYLEAHRRLTAVQHARWLLATFIDIPVFTPTEPYCWAFLDFKYALVACGMADGLHDAPQDAYSDVSLIPQLQPTPTAEYYSALGISSSDFRVPDLGMLYSRYLSLTPAKRLRFLRSAESIHAAANPAMGHPQKLVALVSAIEPLLAKAKPGAICRSQTRIAQRFRDFLDAYVHPSPEVKHIYEAIYTSRSKIVHGGWNPEVDEPFLSIHSADETRGLAAWAAARQGVINWLIAQ